MVSTSKNVKLVWKENIPERDWDEWLARLGGHPLQSAYWGSARAEVGEFEDFREAACIDDEVVWMCRYEVRWLPGKVGRVAWVPKGPVKNQSEWGDRAHAEFLNRLKQKGFWLAIENRYSDKVSSGNAKAVVMSAPYRTIWIDLSMGKEALWKRLHKKWRYGVRTSERQGVTVEQTRDPAVVSEFYKLCLNVSETKGFSLAGSKELMMLLLTRDPWPHTEARLFVARYNGVVAAGVAAVRCGESIHYFWGGTDREYGKYSVGEAVQWKVIEWAMQEGYTKYDLEGINPETNPGVYKFKKRMGGEEIQLAGQEGFGLNLQGKVALSFKQKLANRSRNRSTKQVKEDASK